MFGLFFGTVCLVLLFAGLRRHRYASYGPWEGGPFRFGWHGPPPR